MTANDDQNPAATVRAIYRYHAVDNGWGDIGYQYLIDESGTVYEGRWSGTASTSCEDFGHEDGGERVVTGAHTGGWNSGNVGVALLGDFTGRGRYKSAPKAAAVDGLEGLLADLSVRHGLDPEAEVTYVNPVSFEEKVVQTIGGHQDYNATACPGELLYAQLPEIRTAVAERMAAADSGDPTDPTDPTIPTDPVDPDPTDPPTTDPEPPTTMHVGDLDATTVDIKNQWRADVSVTVLDGDGTPVEGATVSGTWSTTGGAGSCDTAADGTCTVTETTGKKDNALTFVVKSVTAGDLAYVSAANTDPDGDSDGTTITVVRAG
ncbi:N-acetylmuramoyl-L-alanine amidase [Ornithinimicrobium kibberense]|uniref:N-acetylmuramoyl-L-alanine amidase n=1 Tax=Ornithinimicrobium kibberense TaxID=282060 RepID=UPI0036110EBE